MKELDDKTNESLKENVQRVSQEPSKGGTAQLLDNRSSVAIQRKLQDSMNSSGNEDARPIQRKSNKTGLPDNLKSGIENLSGYSMDDVKVHYNSSKPAQLQAHAYAQGTDIHLGSGQEKHLAHEAWHVVQQKQGRVKPTRQLKSKVNINDDEGLEREADVMGERALRGQVMMRGAGISSGMGTENIGSNQSGIMQQKKYRENGLNGEQIIQAKGWIRNRATGRTTAYGGNDGAVRFANDPETEYMEHRFMESGDAFAYGPNYEIDPDVEHDEDNPNGVTDIPEEFQRPDDVERNPDYRRAVHRFQDLYFFLQDSNPNRAKEIDFKLKRHQDEAKKYAKEFKKNKRNLKKTDRNFAHNTYTEKMRLLTGKIDNDFNSYEESRIMTDEDFVNSKNKWRVQWRRILDVVESVLREKWPVWRKRIQRNVSRATGINKMVVRRENWRLKFGGSLGKGYKGPPKQNVRFITTRFDVDANMDAPALANYLLGKDDRKIDRGTIEVLDNDNETQVKEMDREMDQGIRDELVEKEIATQEQVDPALENGIVSEEFETLINARDGKLNDAAQVEWNRSNDEQKLRDDITKLNAEEDRTTLNLFVKNVSRTYNLKGLIKRDRHGYFFLIKSRHLGKKDFDRDEIDGLRHLLEESKKGHIFPNQNTCIYFY